MFPDNEIEMHSLWISNPPESEYIATCVKCGKEWSADGQDKLKEAMIKAGVLK